MIMSLQFMMNYQWHIHKNKFQKSYFIDFRIMWI